MDDRVDYAQHIANFAADAQSGGTGFVEMAGRLLGLGQDERKQLARSAVPWWVWLGLGAAAGVVVGCRVQKRWPRALPRLVCGG